MWRGAATGFSSKVLLSSHAAFPNSCTAIFPSSYTLSTVADGVPRRGSLFLAHVHSTSTTGSWKQVGAVANPGLTVGSSVEAAVLSPPAATSLISKNAIDVATAIQHYGRCYWELSKAKLSMLVVATSGAGFVLGSGRVIDFAGLCYTCAGTMMVAAAANSLNQVFEVKNDAKMKRTRQRPLPSGRLSVSHAAIWASSVGVTGCILLASKANFLAAGLAASNLALYAFVYTPLKQMHPVNTWIGAIVGAIPPLLGWAAASGEVSLKGMILPAALYFWQIPHFMALAYFCRNDYIAGGFQMFSLADASGRRTAFVSLRNCFYLLPIGYLAYDWDISSGWFAVESSFLTLCMSAAALSFVLDRTSKKARRMFHVSLIYLPFFMFGLLLHRHPNDKEEFIMRDSNEQDGILICEAPVQDVEDSSQSMLRRGPFVVQPCPPVAYASVAPFPFLPAPSFAASGPYVQH